MSSLTLVVKGGKHEAKAAARLRGLPFDFVHEYRQRNRCETIGTVPAEHWRAVWQWFAEPGVAPYQPGTVLFYR